MVFIYVDAYVWGVLVEILFHHPFLWVFPFFLLGYFG